MRQGFTILEILIVLAISTLLTGIALTYNSATRNEIALSVEATKISQLILRAESLSIATYGTATAACGYGISFNIPAQTYSIFAYRPAGACPVAVATTSAAAMRQYTPGTWNVRVAVGVNVTSSADSIRVILFYPPEPQTFISRDGSNFLNPTQTSNVHLVTADGKDSRTISVNSGGQVSF